MSEATPQTQQNMPVDEPKLTETQVTEESRETALPAATVAAPMLALKGPAPPSPSPTSTCAASAASEAAAWLCSISGRKVFLCSAKLFVSSPHRRGQISRHFEVQERVLAMLKQGLLDQATAVQILGTSALDKATSAASAGAGEGPPADACVAAKRGAPAEGAGQEDELDKVLKEAKRTKMDSPTCFSFLLSSCLGSLSVLGLPVQMHAFLSEVPHP